jgi:hypothetical protein
VTEVKMLRPRYSQSSAPKPNAPIPRVPPPKKKKPKGAKRQKLQMGTTHQPSYDVPAIKDIMMAPRTTGQKLGKNARNMEHPIAPPQHPSMVAGVQVPTPSTHQMTSKSPDPRTMSKMPLSPLHEMMPSPSKSPDPRTYINAMSKITQRPPPLPSLRPHEFMQRPQAQQRPSSPVIHHRQFDWNDVNTISDNES